jgi:ABC-2 type transport system permease protein
MVVALPAVVLVPLIGAIGEGVRLDTGQWIQATLGVWLAAIPFAVLGLLLGQYGTADSMQSITSVLMMVLAMFGGLWVPLDALPSFFSDVAHVLPSYWMTRVGAGDDLLTSCLSSLGGLSCSVRW